MKNSIIFWKTHTFLQAYVCIYKNNNHLMDACIDVFLMIIRFHQKLYLIIWIWMDILNECK